MLLLLLFSQCAVYLAEYAHLDGNSGEIPFEMQMLSTSATGSLRELDGSLLIPSLIAVSSDGEAAAVMNSAAVIDEIYADVGRCLFSGLERKPVLVSEADWRQMTTMDSYVYVLYPSELPYQVVYAFAAAREESDHTIRQADSYVGVREVLLVPGESGVLTHMLVRGTGGVYSYSLDNTVSLDTFVGYKNAYSDMFHRGYVLADDLDVGFVIDEKISVRGIFASEGSAALLRSNGEHMDVVFRLLNFNPDKLRYHAEEDGTYVYVESHGNLRIDSRTIAYSSSEQGGIRLSKILGQDATGDIYTYLQTASYLIRRLSSMDMQYTGGDAHLRLKSLSSSGDSVTLIFAYFADNIELYASGKQLGLSITFTGDTIRSITYNTAVVRRSLSEYQLMLQQWSKKQMVGDTRAYMYLVYRMDENDIAIAGEWMAYPEARVGGGRR